MSTKLDGLERAAKFAQKYAPRGTSDKNAATILVLIAELRTIQAENERLKAVDETFGEYDH